MSHQTQQGNGSGEPAVRSRSLLGAVSRRAVGYCVERGEPEAAEVAEVAGPVDEGTAEFEVPGGPRSGVGAPESPVAPVSRVATVVLPLTRSGAYEREAVDARLAELESEL